MDSQDQAIEQSTNEQSEVVNSDEVQNEQSQTFEVWWQNLTWAQLLENYKKLQWEYTKSRQELSDLQKNKDIPDDEKNAIEVLEKHWFVRQSDLEAFTKKQKDQDNLRTILINNPSLKQYEWAIQSLWEKDWLAYEDVIEKYGFASKDKLAKARMQWDIVWNPNMSWKEKSIDEMTIQEYEKWKIKQGIGKWGTFS